LQGRPDRAPERVSRVRTAPSSGPEADPAPRGP
jgi:hypothetical protein